jgi:hypothetical protein
MHCVGRNSQWFHGENAFTTALVVGIMRCMSQTPEPWVPPASAAPPPSKPDSLYRVAAWVVIVGGIILIVASVFFVICAIWCCH